MATKATTTKTANAKATDAQATTDAKAQATQKTQAQAKADTTVVTADDAPTKTKDYTAAWALHHNNKAYKAGETVALTDAEAEALFPSGVIVPVDVVEAVTDAVVDAK